MSSIVATKGIAGAIEKIINKAESLIVIVSPYLQIDDKYRHRLKAADEEDVRIIICYRQGELKSTENKFFKELKNLVEVPIPNLHSKYFFNNRGDALVGSMNLYKHSEDNNWELGVLLDIDEGDFELLYPIYVEFRLMLKANGKAELEKEIRDYLSEPFPFVKGDKGHEIYGKFISKEEFKDFHSKHCNVKTGFCIRCGCEKDYFPDYPYCKTCYWEVVKIGNIKDSQKICHRCSMLSIVSFAYPQCPDCENLYRFELSKIYDPAFNNNT